MCTLILNREERKAAAGGGGAGDDPKAAPRRKLSLYWVSNDYDYDRRKEEKR